MSVVVHLPRQTVDYLFGDRSEMDELTWDVHELRHSLWLSGASLKVFWKAPSECEHDWSPLPRDTAEWAGWNGGWPNIARRARRAQQRSRPNVYSVPDRMMEAR